MQKTPNLKPSVMNLDLDYTNRLLGTTFNREKVRGLLEKMRYGVEFFDNNENLIKIFVPAYRTDVLHQIDLVEDIAIAYGYENFKPELLDSHTIGRKDKREKFSDKLREIMIGSGFQEVMTLTLTNERNLFLRMNLEPEKTTVAENPVSNEHGIARTWLLPSLMGVLENNKNREYPQMLFEIGECVTADGKNYKKLAGVAAHTKTNFSEIKSVVTGILESIGCDYKIKNSLHRSFIEGRCADCRVIRGNPSIAESYEASPRDECLGRGQMSPDIGFGFFGEIHPQVLESFGLETPVTGFEIDLDDLIE